jgi:phosphatidylserine decarboxylase
MTLRAALATVLANEDLNFLLTNRIPRRLATQFMGWFSRIEQPLVRDASLAVWRHFADLDLHEAEQARFRSIQDCFTRALKPGARPVDADPGVIVSPCDAIVGACGAVAGTSVIQAKGYPYAIEELVADRALAERYRDGTYATLRLTSSMYHRFHAPADGRIEAVDYIAGDTWNVNPIALARIERLFCRNERATVRIRMAGAGHLVTLVPVAAILVASIRLHCLGLLRDAAQTGRSAARPDAPCARGAELGWFEHGSTIIVFAPSGFALCEGVAPGAVIRMGRRLMRLPDAPSAPAPSGSSG